MKTTLQTHHTFLSSIRIWTNM